MVSSLSSSKSAAIRGLVPHDTHLVIGIGYAVSFELSTCNIRADSEMNFQQASQVEVSCGSVV